MRKYVFLTLLCWASFFAEFACAAEEKIVLISGLSFERACACGSSSRHFVCDLIPEQDCQDEEYMMSDVGDLIKGMLFVENKAAGVHSFKWSRDFVSHGESLKQKFKNWFGKEVCPITIKECNVSFIAHSWGTVILSDFLASFDSSNVKIRNIITYGSPVSGAQIEYNKDPFWQVGIDNFKINKLNPSSQWRNLVHPSDPIAWNYEHSPAEDINAKDPNLLSTKIRLGEMYPVSNSEFDPKYLETSIIRLGLNLKNLKKNVIKQVIFMGLTNKDLGEKPDLSKHSIGDQAGKIAKYIVKAIPDCTSKFQDDMPADSYQKNAVIDLCKKLILKGNANGKIQPYDYINRAEFVVLLDRATELSKKEVFCIDTFPDTIKNDWYSKSVCVFSKEGVIKGDIYGNFNPDNFITYAETFKIILKSVGSVDDLEKKQGNWYDGYMKCALSAGLIAADDKDRANLANSFIKRGKVFLAISNALQGKESIREDSECKP